MQNAYLSDIIAVDPENDLEHHGVLGMKWGIRRYQPYSLIPRGSGKGGKETGAAKKAKPTGQAASKKKTRKQKSVEAKAAVEKQAKTARQRREELEKVANSGDAKLVYEHRHEMSKKQLDTAIERINTEARLSQLVKYQNPTKLDKLADFAKKVDKVNSITRTGLDSYKNISEAVSVAKKASQAKTKVEKAEASAAVLNEIIKNGNRSYDILRNQSKLSKEDLNTLAQRTRNLQDVEKDLRQHSDWARKDNERRTKEASNSKAKREAYLRKSLAELSDEREHPRYDLRANGSNNEAYDAYVDSILTERKKRKSK